MGVSFLGGEGEVSTSELRKEVNEHAIGAAFLTVLARLMFNIQ